MADLATVYVMEGTEAFPDYNSWVVGVYETIAAALESKPGDWEMVDGVHTLVDETGEIIWSFKGYTVIE